MKCTQDFFINKMNMFATFYSNRMKNIFPLVDNKRFLLQILFLFIYFFLFLFFLFCFSAVSAISAVFAFSVFSIFSVFISINWTIFKILAKQVIVRMFRLET